MLRSCLTALTCVVAMEDLFEHACHEGNYSMSLMLSGQRAIERQGRASSR